MGEDFDTLDFWGWERVRTSCGFCFRVGPLNVQPNGKPNFACIYADYPGQMELEKAEAFARLFSASRALLAALKHARSQMHYPDQMIDDAIAMAEGSTEADILVDLLKKAEGR